MIGEEAALAARTFEALGHPRRVEIVRALADFGASPSELARRLGCSWTTVAKHLKVLRDAGLVNRYQAEYGTGYGYAMSPGAFEQLRRCIELLR